MIGTVLYNILYSNYSVLYILPVVNSWNCLDIVKFNVYIILCIRFQILGLLELTKHVKLKLSAYFTERVNFGCTVQSFFFMFVPSLFLMILCIIIPSKKNCCFSASKDNLTSSLFWQFWGGPFAAKSWSVGP